MNRLLAVFLITLLAAGCATKPKPSHEARLRERVKIAMYDSSPRTAKDQIDIYDDLQPIKKSYKSIALITCEGAAHEEPEMTEAIIYRAKKLGVDAAIVLLPTRYNDRSVLFPGDRC